MSLPIPATSALFYSGYVDLLKLRDIAQSTSEYNDRKPANSTLFVLSWLICTPREIVFLEIVLLSHPQKLAVPVSIEHGAASRAESSISRIFDLTNCLAYGDWDESCQRKSAAKMPFSGSPPDLKKDLFFQIGSGSFNRRFD